MCKLGCITDINKDINKALIVVDMQNDFVDPKGSLYIKGGEKLTRNINRFIDKNGEKYEMIVFTKDWHPIGHSSFNCCQGIWKPHCIHQSWGSELTLRSPTSYRVFNTTCLELCKAYDFEDSYGAFLSGINNYDNGLNGILKSRKINKVDIMGVALDFCVKNTAIQAINLNYDTSVIVNYTLSINSPFVTIKELQSVGVNIINYI